MNSTIRSLVKIPVLGRSVLALYRTTLALQYFRSPLVNLVRWIITSREVTNYTYDLTELNKQHLASLVAHVTGISYEVAGSYIEELENDEELHRHIEHMSEQSESSHLADKKVRFGRRLGWYAFVRALKPRLIVETGVDKGLGACVLTAALNRNWREGFKGRYVGTDINVDSGWLLTGCYAEHGKILFGDSLESLSTLEGKIDLFINDSDHSEDYEWEEYQAIADKLSEAAVILGDNSHCTDKLLQFSLRKNRQFLFFQEKPRKHWYPGAGIGISFKDSGSA